MRLYFDEVPMIFIVDREYNDVAFIDILLLQHSKDHVLGLSEGGRCEERVKQFVLGLLRKLLLHQLNVYTHDVVIQPLSLVNQSQGFVC